MVLSFLAATVLRQADGLVPLNLKVDGVPRSALVYAPRKLQTGAAPLILAFHGHYGTSRFAARRFALHSAWPEAIVIYPQGLPTETPRDPSGGGAGWQLRSGGQGDRDLHFYDSLLTWAKSNYRIDPKRVYVMGHSNGGGFAYLLWKERRGDLAAIAPVAAGTTGLFRLQPLPVIHVAGRADTTVPFAGQQLTVNGVKRVNGCQTTPEPYGAMCEIFRGREGNDVAFFITPGGHSYPEEATQTILRFFQEHPKSGSSGRSRDETTRFDLFDSFAQSARLKSKAHADLEPR